MNVLLKCSVPKKTRCAVNQFQAQALSPEKMQKIKGGNGGAQGVILPPPSGIIVIDDVVTIR